MRAWLKWSREASRCARGSSAPSTALRVVDEAAASASARTGQPPPMRVRVVERARRSGSSCRCEAVLLVVVHRRERPVDRDLGEVGPAEARELGVEVGEEPRLQQRVVGEVDARHDVADAEGDLLGLGEEVVGVAVERQLADAPHRHELLGDELGRVEQVEAERQLVLLVDDLQAELVLGVVAGLDRLPQVAAVEVGVLAGDLLRLVPDERVRAEQRLPVELARASSVAAGVDQPEGVDAEALHHAVAARDARGPTSPT